MREGWVRATLNYGAYKVRSGHLLAALLTDPKLSRWLRATVPELYGLPTDRVLRELVAVTAGSAEADEAAADGGPPAAASAGGGQAPRPRRKPPAPAQF